MMERPEMLSGLNRRYDQHVCETDRHLMQAEAARF